MQSEFYLSGNQNPYLSHFRTKCIVAIFFIILSMKTYSKYQTLMHPFFIAMCVGVIVLLIITFIRARNEKYSKYILNDKQIIWRSRRSECIYEFSNLTEFYMTAADDAQKFGMEGMELKFKDQRKLKLSNDVPYYHELKEAIWAILDRHGYLEGTKIIDQ